MVYELHHVSAGDKKITETKKRWSLSTVIYSHFLPLWQYEIRQSWKNGRKHKPKCFHAQVLSVPAVRGGGGMDLFMCSVHMCIQVCKDMGVLMWRPELTLDSFLNHSPSLFEIGSYGEPGVHQFGQVGQPVSFQCQPISAAPLQRSQAHANAPFFTMNSGNPLRFSCLHGRHLTDLAVFTAPCSVLYLKIIKVSNTSIQENQSLLFTINNGAQIPRKVISEMKKETNIRHLYHHLLYPCFWQASLIRLRIKIQINLLVLYSDVYITWSLAIQT